MNRRTKRILLALVGAIVVAVAQQFGLIAPDGNASGSLGGFTSPGSASLPVESDGGARIAQALAARESGFMVTVDARVTKTLPDDLEGSRHQRFLILVDEQYSILVAHNIDLADRIPLDRGDRVRVRGQFEWNEKGGVLHWTHHDPAGRHPGGWIESQGRRVE